MPEKNILITGGLGFIGSNFIPHFLESNPHYHIFNLDAVTYAADKKNLEEVESHSNYHFIQGNICDEKLVESLFAEHKFKNIIHFAAESHVDNSINSPGAFMQTNIIGTFNLLNAAFKLWHESPFKTKEEFQTARFLHVSTDEVYGSLGKTGLFSEDTPYAPNSPYSASKASSDFIVRSYFHTYGLNTVTTNCSNNYGPKQHDEKLIPTIIRNALSEKSIPIYGEGTNIRDWLYVKDHCKGVELALKTGRAGETYNIGGNNERTNNQICHKICELLDDLKPRQAGSYKDLITYVKDRPGHDFRYAINAGKIKENLNWKPDENFESGIIKTLNWYLRKYSK